MQMGKTPSRDIPEYWNNGEHDWVSIKDLGSYEKYVGKTSETISELGRVKSGIKSVPANTLLMSFKLSLGKTAITTKETYTNEAIMAFLDKGTYDVDIDYMWHQLQSKDWTVGTNTAVMGKTLNKKTLSATKIRVPSISEQKEIAKHLDVVQETLSLLSLELKTLDDLVKSQFVEMFGNVSTTCRVQDVATTYNGDRGKNYPTADDKVLAGYPFINAGNLEGGKVSFDSMDYITAEKYQTLSGGKIRKDDILYCLRGSLGKSAICDFDGGTIASSLMVIRANIDEVSPRYLFEALNTPDVIRQMHAADSGSSQPNLSAKSVKSYLIPLPSKELQQQFADFVARVDKLGFDCCREIICCGVLFSSMSASLLCT